MKKLFKKSIACLIAVLMVVYSMPFTALTANAALAYLVTGQYDFTSTISDSTFSNAVEGYSGRSYILKGNAWDRDHGLASNSTNNIFDLKTIYNTYPCVTKATSGQAMTFRYDNGNATVNAENVGLTGLYMYDGFIYIDNIGSYLGGKGFRISWTEQYFSKNSDSGAGVFSLGTGNNGDVLKWTTNDNKLYAGGSEALPVTPVDGTIYDITLTSGSDKKISVLVKNHSTKETVIDYTTSGTFEPTSLNYLVIGSVNQSLDKLGRFTLSNLTIEKAYDSSDPTSAFKESADYVKSHVETFEGYTGTVTQSADSADGYNATNFWNTPASGIEDKMSNVLYAKGCVNAPWTSSDTKTRAVKYLSWYYYVYTGIQYGDMVYLYDGENECANIVMCYAKSDAKEGGMRNMAPTSSDFEIKTNWHSNGAKEDKSYSNTRNWAFGPVDDKYHKFGNDDTTRYFYNSLYYVGVPTTTITTFTNLSWRATIYSTSSGYDRSTADFTFGNTNNKNGTTTVYIVNYQPIKEKIDDIKSTYANVKKAGDTAYCAASLDAYYRAVEKVLKLNPNSYSYSTNVSAAVTSVGADIDDVVNNYLTIATTEPKKHKSAEPVRENEQPATCTAPGSYDEVVKCSNCNVEISRTPKTTPALGHSFTNYVRTVDPTCTKVGTETATCERCDVTDTRDVAIDESAHNWGNWVDDNNGSTHTKTCSYNNEHKVTENHTIENGECTKCHYIAKVTIRFVDENDGFISSAEYNIGADVVVPELPEQTEVYVGDSQHKVTTYSWNEIPQATASQAATYKRVKTESTVACSNELMQKGETSDTWHCTVCGHVYERDVIDMSALKANIKALETAVNVDDAAYKYETSALENAKSILNAAKDYVANDNNRYASIQDVNAMSTSVGTAYTKLTVDGLAKYSQTFIIRKDDGKGNTTDIATFTQGYENLAYGSTVEFSDYTIPTINDGSTLTGLPMYAVYKWVKTVNGVEQKLGTTDVQISDVVKGETTYICYVLDFKATDETQKTTRVRYLDKSGNTIKFDTATVGEPYTRKDTSIAPIIPYYNCTGWEPLFGDETNVGTRELVYRAIYTFNETEANRCTIVGLPGVYVNGTTGTPGYTAYYDEKIQLTGADKYAYANADGSIIAPINESYIFAPHLNGVDKTIYITKVETPITEAKSIVTGVFTTHADPTYNYLVINAQYYLPEGAKAVEAGAVIGKYNNADTLKIGSALKVVSDTQGDNHEYSLQMSYSKNKTGTLYARSYLIYVDSNGDTQTVYSDDITTCNLD